MIELPRAYPNADFSRSTVELFLFYHVALDQANHPAEMAQYVEIGPYMLVETPCKTKQVYTRVNVVVGQTFARYAARPGQTLTGLERRLSLFSVNVS